MDRSQQLAGEINDRLSAAGRPTIAAAESCSGGGVAAAITAWPGSSNYFLGSIVAYVNEAKASLLGVSTGILEHRGAVSTECAEAMAVGARAAFGSDIAVSVTGIAGPSGATSRKPVGLVYLGLVSDQGTVVEEHQFEGDRAAITRASIETALELVLMDLKKRASARTDQ